jgi:hypothetical protein
MEQYLWNVVNYLPDDWVRWLPLAEFGANNHTLEMPNSSGFFVNYSFHPQITFGKHPIKDPNDIREVHAQQMAQRMEQLFSHFRAEVKLAQAIQSEQDNKSQSVRSQLQIEDNV